MINKEKNNKTTTRVQMELPNKSIERLKLLKDKTEASSYAEVTKNAYRLYEKMILLAEEDNTLLIRDANGKIKEISFFI